MAFSHTMLDTAQRCAKKYEYRYVRGYRRKVMKANVELGTWVHELLAEYFRKGDAQARHTSLVNEWWKPLFDEEKEALGADLPETAWRIYERYVAHWAQDDKGWKRVVALEVYVKVPLPYLPQPFGFKCDVILLDRNGWVWIMDHKVVKDIPNEDSRDLDTQGPRYILALREYFRRKGINPRGFGVVYDYVRSTLPNKPERTKTDKVSTRWIDTDVETYTQGLIELGEDPKDYAEMLDRIARDAKPFFERWMLTKSNERLDQEAKDLAVLAGDLRNMVYYPRTLDRNRCAWDCEFKELCLIELEGGDIGPVLDAKFDVRKGGDADEQPHDDAH